jgi:hypothetical protein
VIAICNATGVEADGIEHDFKTRQFTPLGNYREFLTRQIVVEGASKIAAGQKAAGAQAALKAKETGSNDDQSEDSEVLARTAIKLVVR